jgi:DisA bacterial checkpoint controller linker region.
MTITGAMNPNVKTGNCEICDKVNVDLALHYGNIWFCNTCWLKEEKSTKENTSPEAIQSRLEAVSNYNISPVNDAVKESNRIDSTINVRTDLFNAATIAIMDLKKSIDADESITNKPFTLASELKNRFEHYKQVVFELNEKVVEAGNNQKAIQIYLNNLANQLRADEREKLKIADISYSTKPIKTTVKKISTSKKIDKIELRKFASELGISEFTLQMVVVQKGISVADAAFLLKKSIESAKK